MGIERKINRNKLKKAHKNNKINKSWREFQIHNYGIQKWCKMYNQSNNIKDKGNKITPSTAHYV